MKTKKNIVIGMAILSLFTISCSEVDKLLTFTVSDEVTLKINSGLSVDTPFEIPTPDITTNSSEEFKNNNTKADLVKDVTLKELKLSIVSPADKTFSFLKSVHMYISTTNDNEIEVAYLDNISTTANSINLTCTSQKLDQYIKASTYKLRTAIVTKETFGQNIEVKANMQFKVTADPF
ncbi:hypothetical protein [Flavobacterium sp. 5]|uniref:hypothetical protein n=1 Tax=Flavobacterium sp. 5 TaxID=2035199 RepID=UPI000C2C4439|nr:hypothetical protein [Flavobacterium sp. 5]PKB15618.1 hypothetical protein CLU82_0702 [Flavobacterium sp. 5]